ncbi:hypothetical protein [Serratia quinivorans]
MKNGSRDELVSILFETDNTQASKVIAEKMLQIYKNEAGKNVFEII